MNRSFFDKAAECFPDSCFKSAPDLGIVLGSGWGDALEMDDVLVRVSYADIAGFGPSSVQGHAGEFILYRRGARRIAAWCTRALDGSRSFSRLRCCGGWGAVRFF